MQALWEDVRFALRVLARQKLLTAVAAVTLALGMGMNTAIFSTVSGILWNTLPYPQAERLVAVHGQNIKMGFNRASVSFRDAEDWRSAGSIERLSEYRFARTALSSAGEPQSVLAIEASGDFFEVLGEKAALGRTFDDSERKPGEHRVVVISEGLWRREFGGDPKVLGREMKIDGRIHNVIGVMPPGFSFLYSRAEVFLPLRLTEIQRTGRDARGLSVVARLAPGRSIEQADAEVQRISKSIGEAEPEAARGWSGRVRPLELDVIDRGARISIGTMFWAVMGVLLIACTNIASLLLARGTLRQRELAIRASLGAGRARIARLLLTESVVLSLLGGLLGTAFAAWAIPVIRSLAPKDFPRLEFVQLNTAALGYTFLLCLACGLIAGLTPAWLLSRGEIAQTLHQGGRGGTFSRQRLLQSLVAAEVALAMTLLTVTGLLVRSLAGQIAGDPGFDKTRLVTAAVSLPLALYPEKRQQSDFFRTTLDALRRDPRIEHASAVQTIPLGGSNSWAAVTIEGRATTPEESNLAGFMVVLPGYFDTMRVPLLAGRDFSNNDTADTPLVAVVNQAMARRYWPNDPRPLGRRFRIEKDWITIVGLARDVRHHGPTWPARPEIYLPLAQSASRRMVLVARTHGDPARAASAVRDAVWSADRNQPLSQIETMDDLIDRRLAGPRVTVQILGFLALLALLLAGLGIYGVLSYLTSQRAREFGIRVALGAVRGDVVWLVLKRGFLLAGLGLAIGIAGAAAVTPLVRSILNGIQPHDAVSFSLSAAALLLVAVFACAFPVLRALRLDPVRVLREE